MTLEEFENATWERIEKYGEKFKLGITLDENGNETSFKDEKGFWSERIYDKNGNISLFWTSVGDWSEYKYNTKGHLTLLTNSEGHKLITTYEKDEELLGDNEKWKTASFTTPEGFWYKATNDKLGNQLSYENENYWSKSIFNKDEELAFENSKGTYEIREESVSKEEYEKFIKSL